MIAMVLCAGEGTRLRPLTYALPKPMMPLLSKPVLAYTLENLKRHGFQQVVINLSYQADKIKSYFGEGSQWGLKIHYSLEKELLGTAGGVKKVEPFFRQDPDPDFLITSGDGITDINFTDLIRFHRQKKAFGTIALKRVQSRFEYGIPLRRKNGRITRFVEKPYWGDIFSDEVNTGIYVFDKKVFDQIPAKKFCDFGNTLWPKLLHQRKPIYGYPFQSYWTDIGDIREYHQAQWAILDKKIKVDHALQEIRPKIWIGKKTKIGSNVRLEAPCFIGNNCTIEKNATIGQYAVIGDRSQVGSGAVITHSILWNDVGIGQKVSLSHATIGMHVKLQKGFPFLQGIVLNHSV